MQPEVRGDSRCASVFATLVCAWALALVVFGLAAPLRTGPNAPAPAAVTADVRP